MDRSLNYFRDFLNFTETLHSTIGDICEDPTFDIELEMPPQIHTLYKVARKEYHLMLSAVAKLDHLAEAICAWFTSKGVTYPADLECDEMDTLLRKSPHNILDLAASLDIFAEMVAKFNSDELNFQDIGSTEQYVTEGNNSQQEESVSLSNDSDADPHTGVAKGVGKRLSTQSKNYHEGSSEEEPSFEHLGEDIDANQDESYHSDEDMDSHDEDTGEYDATYEPHTSCSCSDCQESSPEEYSDEQK